LQSGALYLLGSQVTHISGCFSQDSQGREHVITSAEPTGMSITLAEAGSGGAIGHLGGLT